MNKDDFSYWTRACKPAKEYTGHLNLRCSNCPFPDCILATPRLKKGILVAKIAKLVKAFGYTQKITIESFMTGKE